MGAPKAHLPTSGPWHCARRAGRKRMQTKSGTAGRAVYDLLLKNRALKLLIDYSAATRRGWTRIRNEIIDVTGAPATDQAPLLNRQDFEHWADGKVIGDEKFRYIFEFLTHPATLARPEFAKAADLLDHNRLLRIGQAFGDFLWDPSVSGFFRRIPPVPLDPELVRRRIASFEGYFVGHEATRDLCLSLQRAEGQKFMVAHLFAWPRVRYGEPFDWEIHRWSGYCTVGSFMRAHLKGVLMRETRDLYLMAHRAPKDAETPTFSLLNSGFVTQALDFAASAGGAQDRLKFVDPAKHTLVMERVLGPEIETFVDQFRWMVPE